MPTPADDDLPEGLHRTASSLGTIQITDLEVFCHVGVTAEERKNPQKLLLCVEMAHDFAAAARTDDLARTINYFAVYERILQLCGSREWNLIETLAVTAAENVVREFGAAQVTVEVKKFVLPQTRSVSVRVTRP